MTTRLLLSLLCASLGFAAAADNLFGQVQESNIRGSKAGKSWKDVDIAHEIWLVDQSDTNGFAYGGTIYILDAAAVREDPATAALSSEKIDLGAETSTMCFAYTGANPVRPHFLLFNRAGTHASLAFVASGHVVILDAVTRQPVACFRSEVGDGGKRQAHMAVPTPDSQYILVANQNGKKFERIKTDYANNIYEQEPSATVDLVGCTTPNGFACQDAALRPDNAPICPFVPASGFPAFVSLRGGGMLALDPYVTPMAIVAEFDNTTVKENGCGFVESSGYVYGNGGGGTSTNKDGWYIYRLPLDRDDRKPSLYNPLNPPNTPMPEEISKNDASPRDAHGAGVSVNGKNVWFFDRAANLIETFGGKSGKLIQVEDLVTDFSADPTPDLMAAAPDGKAIYASLRGPIPLSGDPHASTGSTPGLMVFETRLEGRDLIVQGIVPISNVNSTGYERADAHGIAVRIIANSD